MGSHWQVRARVRRDLLSESPVALQTRGGGAGAMPLAL